MIYAKISRDEIKPRGLVRTLPLNHERLPTPETIPGEEEATSVLPRGRELDDVVAALVSNGQSVPCGIVHICQDGRSRSQRLPDVYVTQGREPCDDLRNLSPDCRHRA